MCDAVDCKELQLDRPEHECGVLGVYNLDEAPQLLYYGLHALQHRGQESAGIVTSDGNHFTSHRDRGLVTEAFGNEELSGLIGRSGIGHVRYTMKGKGSLSSIQPFIFKYRQGEIALAINGGLVNGMEIRERLVREGSIFQTTSDIEVIAHLIAKSTQDYLEDAVKDALGQLIGAYALVILNNEKLIAATDPHGIRPFSLARLNGGYVVSSETCAFEEVGAEYIRDIEPGEMLVFSGDSEPHSEFLDEDGLFSEQFAAGKKRASCAFEYIYFARPDSDICGINLHLARKRLGKRLAQESPVEADVVTGVPDSSISAAIGYAEESGIPFELGLIKNRYIGRTFIQPSQALREKGVRMKLSSVRKVVEGKRVVMIDDSIVRGTTSGRIVRILREAGASEVHVRISSPPVKDVCYYGIDISSRDELVAANMDIETMRKHIGADSLEFISIEGMVDALNMEHPEDANGYCLACFNSKYPTRLLDR